MKTYPGCKNWLTWWMHPDRIRMLFLKQSDPSPELITTEPTTNAQEALHFALYNQEGKKGLSTIEGLRGAHRYVDALHIKYSNAAGK